MDIKKISSFTLLELLVVVVLIGLISTAVIVDSSDLKHKREVRKESSNVYSFLIKLQQTAFSEYENINVSLNSGTITTDKTDFANDVYSFDISDNVDLNISPSNFTVNRNRSFSDNITIVFSKNNTEYNRINIFGQTGLIVREFKKDNVWIRE